MIGSYRSLRLNFYLSFTFLVLVFQILVFDLPAQTEIEQFYFKKMEGPLAIKGLREVISTETENSSEDWQYGAFTYTTINGNSYYLMSSNASNHGNGKEVFLIRDKELTQDKWHLSEQKFPKEAEGRPDPESSYLFWLKDALVLALSNRFYDYHLYTAESVSFYSLKDDSFFHLGTIPLHFDDRQSDSEEPMGRRKFFRKLEKFSEEKDHILIKSIYYDDERSSYSKYFTGYSTHYGEIYQLNYDRLFITQKPVIIEKNYINTKMADASIRRIFEDYYSDNWKAKTVEERAQRFLPIFTKLSQLRPDFAPAYYNQACMQAILGNTESGLNNLKQAIKLDPEYKIKALRDSDLKLLRGYPEFQELVK